MNSMRSMCACSVWLPVLPVAIYAFGCSGASSGGGAASAQVAGTPDAPAAV